MNTSIILSCLKYLYPTDIIDDSEKSPLPVIGVVELISELKTQIQKAKIIDLYQLVHAPFGNKKVLLPSFHK
jgi:hypothetical protein